MSRYQRRLKSLDKQLPKPPDYLDTLSEEQLERIHQFLEFADANCIDDNASKAFEYLDNLSEPDRKEIINAGLNMGFLHFTEPAKE